MREMVIVFDSVRYDQFVEADAPNLKSVGKTRRAYTHGRWTRPSMASILSGYLPYCPEESNPWRPSWVYMDFGEEPRVFFNTSPWCTHLHPIKAMSWDYENPRSGAKIIQDMIKARCGTAVALLSETHVPYSHRGLPDENADLDKRIWNYNHGEEDPELPDAARRAQREAIEYLDALMGPLLDSFTGKVYFTSDHGELLGEDHKIGHDPSFPHHKKLFEVPLIVGEM